MAGSDVLAIDDLLDILKSTDSLKEANGVSGFLVGFQLILDDQGDLGDIVNSMTSGEN